MGHPDESVSTMHAAMNLPGVKKAGKMRFLTCCVVVTKCLPDAKQNQNPNEQKWIKYSWAERDTVGHHETWISRFSCIWPVLATLTVWTDIGVLWIKIIIIIIIIIIVVVISVYCRPID